jgi:hypothetical protein
MKNVKVWFKLQDHTNNDVFDYSLLLGDVTVLFGLSNTGKTTVLDEICESFEGKTFRMFYGNPEFDYTNFLYNWRDSFEECISLVSEIMYGVNGDDVLKCKTEKGRPEYSSVWSNSIPRDSLMYMRGQVPKIIFMIFQLLSGEYDLAAIDNIDGLLDIEQQKRFIDILIREFDKTRVVMTTRTFTLMSALPGKPKYIVYRLKKPGPITVIDAPFIDMMFNPYSSPINVISKTLGFEERREEVRCLLRELDKMVRNNDDLDNPDIKNYISKLRGLIDESDPDLLRLETVYKNKMILRKIK